MNKDSATESYKIVFIDFELQDLTNPLFLKIYPVKKIMFFDNNLMEGANCKRNVYFPLIQGVINFLKDLEK